MAAGRRKHGCSFSIRVLIHRSVDLEKYPHPVHMSRSESEAHRLATYVADCPRCHKPPMVQLLMDDTEEACCPDCNPVYIPLEDWNARANPVQVDWDECPICKQ